VSINSVRNTASRPLTQKARQIVRALLFSQFIHSIRRQQSIAALSLFFGLSFIQPLTAVAASLCGPPTHSTQYHVRQVIDGDTVRLEDGSLLRLIGVNTPEIDHRGTGSEPLAKVARQFLKRAIGDAQIIRVADDGEKYGPHHRHLGHAFNQGGENLQALLLSQGLGFWIALPPNLKWMTCYHQQEQNARQARRGIWSLAYYAIHSSGEIVPGFQRIRVTPRRIERRGSWIYLRVNRWLDLRIHRDDLAYFPNNLRKFLQPLQLRGWVSEHGGHRSMRVRHPAAIEQVGIGDGKQGAQ